MKNCRALLGSAVLGLAALSFSATKSYGAIAYALTDENDILVFDTSNPVDLIRGGVVTGLGNQDLIGIDFRPSNGLLYGVGNLGGIFTINVNTFAATQVATLSVPLSGSRFGFDFNPSADLLRIVSDTEQNLRVNVATGIAIVDSPLQYGSGVNPAVTGAAYTNNHDTSLGTTLYDIDVRSNTDNLLIQNPPNSGTLTIAGPLGVDVSALGGFDITQEGPNNTNVGYAALQQIDGGVHRLYSINLDPALPASTPRATLVGVIGGGDLIDGLAIAPVPEPASITVLAIGAVALCGRRRRKA
jgi:hypothetical protein